MCECDEGKLEWYVEKEADSPTIKNWGRKGNQLMREHAEFVRRMFQAQANPERVIKVISP